jgi:hypothetical protein
MTLTMRSLWIGGARKLLPARKVSDRSEPKRRVTQGTSRTLDSSTMLPESVTITAHIDIAATTSR